MIPYLICSPLGGVLADRTQKKKIMYVLDFSTFLLILAYALLIGKASPVLLSTAVLMILYSIQGLYAPSVTASIPYLVEKQDIVQATSVIDTVNSLSRLIGPSAAGVLYGLFGILPMLYVSAVCFLLSALLEVRIRLAEALPAAESRPRAFQEIAGTLRYIRKEQRGLWDISRVELIANMVVGALINLSFPVVVTTMLGFGQAEGSILYGYLQSVMSLGALLGALGAGVFAKRFRPRDMMWLLVLMELPVVTGGLGLLFLPHGRGLYFLLLAAAGIGMFFTGVYNVQAMACIQLLSPQGQTGKIIGCLSVVFMLGQPVGMLLYGWLMELVGDGIGLVFLGSCLAFTGFLLLSRESFRKLDGAVAAARK